MIIREGGGPRPPYKESFLETTVNVHWGGPVGGVFASGDECCFERYTRIENLKDDFKWYGLGSLAFGDGGGTNSGSYGLAKGKPTFLFGGHGPGGAVLMISHDGYSWTTVGAGQIMGQSGHGNIDNLVWDKKENRFYCDAGGQRCFYSDDGVSWFYSADSFDSHCRNPLGAPDGVYGYDKKHDVVIYPDGQGGATAIVDASTMNAQEFSIDVGLQYVFAINYQGGIWMAGGRTASDSATTTSGDGGFSWFYSTVGAIGMRGNYEIFVIISAPLKDMKGVKKVSSSTPGISNFPDTAVATLGGKDASGPQRSRFSPLAAAISPPRRSRLLLRGTEW